MLNRRLATVGSAQWPILVNFSQLSVSDFSLTVNLPAGYKAGDLLIFAAFKSTATGSIDTPSGWTQIDQSTMFSFRTAVFIKVADGTEGDTVTLTYSGDANARLLRARLLAYRNYTGSPVIAVSLESSTLTPQPPNLTTGWGTVPWECISVCFDQNSTGNLVSIPEGYQRIITNVNGSIAVKKVIASSEQPGIWTWDGVKNYVMATIGVRGRR